MGKILIVGESPTREYSQPFTGPVGKRLAQIAGVSHDTLLTQFNFVNILDKPQIFFPVGLATESWDLIGPRLCIENKRIILAGMGVADAVIYGKLMCGRCRDIHICEWMPNPWAGEFAVIPHPAPSNRWYNGVEHRNQVRSFLQSCMEAS